MGLSGCYFVQLAGGQLDLINAQRRLGDAVATERDPDRRRLLTMVPDLRAFARDTMQLRPGRNYTGYYATEADGIAYVLSASDRTRFEPFAFWFPIVGTVHYKSFFDEHEARLAERELARAGYDTWLGRATAYSTLGFFRDPVTTVMMRRGTAAFVEVLLHEMAHARLYVAGQTEWNEQLASFVGRRGAEQYLRSRYPQNMVLLAELDRQTQRRQRVERITAEAIAELDGLYARGLPRAAVLRARRPVFARVSDALRELSPEAEPWELAVNNARLLQYRRYASGAQEFERMWALAGASWVRFWRLAERQGQRLD